MIYATSNRRHLVRETWRDQSDVSSDDMHRNDTVEEKMSLANRFGVSIGYFKPDHEEFLHIVDTPGPCATADGRGAPPSSSSRILPASARPDARQSVTNIKDRSFRMNRSRNCGRFYGTYFPFPVKPSLTLFRYFCATYLDSGGFFRHLFLNNRNILQISVI